MGRDRPSFAALLLALPAACTPDQLVVIAHPPPDVELVGLLMFDRSGALAGSTPLVAGAPDALNGLHQRATADVASVTMVGYARAELAGLLPEDDALLERSPLRIASEVESVLPRALWRGSGTIRGSEVELTDDTTPIDLTAAWMPPCPRIAGPGLPALTDVRCADVPNIAEVTQDGCQLTVDLTSVGLPITRGTLDGRGRLDVDVNPDITSCAASASPPPREAAVSLECGSCPVDLYTGEARSRFELSPPIIVLPGVSLHDGTRGTGYLTDAAVLPPSTANDGCPRIERIAVVTHDGRVAGPGCGDPQPTSIHFFDAETRARTSSIATPACLNEIVGDGGTGMIGLLESSPAVLVRFDCMGRELMRREISNRWVAGGTHSATRLVLSEERAQIAVSFSANTPGPPAFVFAFVVDGFEQTMTSTIPRPPDPGYQDHLETVMSLVSTRNGAVVAGTEPDARLYFIPLDSGTSSWVRPAVGRDVAKGADWLAFAEASELVLVASAATTPVVHTVDPMTATWKDAAAPFEFAAVPAVVEAWPGRQGLAVVAMDRRAPEIETWIAPVDLDIVRVLPGAARAGRGQPGPMRADAEGRLWLLLPGIGEVVRIDAVE